MASDLDTRRPHLVLRLGVGAVAAFLLAGVGVTVFMIRTITERAERVATFHADFVTNSVLAPVLQGYDLTKPLTGSEFEAVDAVVRERILNDGRDVRVKIWDAAGTVLYSDYQPIIGQTFSGETPELREVFDGHVSSGVTDLSSTENVGERAVADELFQTYVPLRLHPGGPVVAIAEVYQDYSVIQGDIDPLLRTLLAIFSVGLLVLFAALLPIALRASRALRLQNRQLREQAEQLGVLLAREQETVAGLRDLNQRTSDFVSAASHELRTPLTSILGSIRTLRRPDFSEDAELRDEFLDTAEQQGTRLLKLIEDLLISARLQDRSGSSLNLSSVDFREVAIEVTRTLRLNGRCRIDVPPDLPAVLTDRDRVREILVELVDNAAKFSPDGDAVEIAAGVTKDWFTFSVHDLGVGIDEETQRRVFDRFYQSDQSATRRFGGLGLGLHVVSSLARELGGTVSAESRAGAGSTFTVILPVAKGSQSIAV